MNSFQHSVKAKIPAEIRPGIASGRMILVRIWTRPAPSIRAHSSSSYGIDLEIAHEQPGRERDQDGRIGQDQGERAVEQAILEDDDRERDEQDRGRHQIGEEDHAADRARAPVAHAHDRVGGHHARDQRQRGRADRDVHGVPHPARIVGLEQQLVEMLERRVDDPPGIVGLHVDQLVVRFDAGQRHPVEREQQDDQEQDERQIDRDHLGVQALEVIHALALVPAAVPPALEQAGFLSRDLVGVQAGQLFGHGRSLLVALYPISRRFRPAATCAAAGRTS